MMSTDLAALESITEVVLSTLDLDELLRRLIQRMVDLSGAQAGVILLLDECKLVPRATVGLDERLVAAYRVPIGQGFAGQVARDGRTRGTSKAIEEGAELAPSLKERGIKSMLAVPLQAAGRTIGVAQIDLLEER